MSKEKAEVQVNGETYQQADEWARKLGISVEKLIEDATRAYLEKQKEA